MDPASWVSLGSSVLGAFKGSTKVSSANAGSFAGASALDLGDWQTVNNSSTLKKWLFLGGAVLVGFVIIKKKYK